MRLDAPRERIFSILHRARSQLATWWGPARVHDAESARTGRSLSALIRIAVPDGVRRASTKR
ncbi:MAG: hypothetical protein WKF73_01360 [Nocardioidaceae bacterium]